MRLGRIAFALGTACAAAAAQAAAPLPDEVLARAEREGRARVIVRLAAPAPGAAAGALERVGASARADARRYRRLPLLALELSAGELAALASAPDVVAIAADRIHYPSLATSVPRVGGDVAAAAGFDGAGTAIAVLDTGIDAAHPFLGGRVTAEACFSAGSDCPNGATTQLGAGAAAPCTYGTQCWHGTHVAGIAAGAGPTLNGVAPAASLISVQTGSRETGAACGAHPSPCVVIYESDALAALDWIADTLPGAEPIAAVNMSFASEEVWSSEAGCDADNAAYVLVIDALRSLGIASVAASGNAGLNTGIAAPACVSSAVGVGATSKTSDAIASLSNFSTPLDLLAPGLGIFSALPGGDYGNGSGTSMAAPHVAGAFAVLRAADPAADVGELLGALASTGVPLYRAGLTRPRIQVDDAVRARAPAACFDGLDNDSDGAVDVDGAGGTPDANCASGLDDSEHPYTTGGCGMGPELALLVPALAALRRRGPRNLPGS
jgi:subtilisin family serine protease